MPRSLVVWIMFATILIFASLIMLSLRQRDMSLLPVSLQHEWPYHVSSNRESFASLLVNDGGKVLTDHKCRIKLADGTSYTFKHYEGMEQVRSDASFSRCDMIGSGMGLVDAASCVPQMESPSKVFENPLLSSVLIKSIEPDPTGNACRITFDVSKFSSDFDALDQDMARAALDRQLALSTCMQERDDAKKEAHSYATEKMFCTKDLKRCRESLRHSAALRSAAGDNTANEDDETSRQPKSFSFVKSMSSAQSCLARADDGAIRLQPCKDIDAQRWGMSHGGAHGVRILNKTDGGMCLTAVPKDGSLKMSKCAPDVNDASQRFAFTNGGAIESHGAAGKCARVDDASRDIRLGDCDARASQQQFYKDTSVTTDTLLAGQTLWADSRLVSSSMQYELMVSSEGNLTLWKKGGKVPIWTTNLKVNKPGSRAMLDDDGRIVLYDSVGSMYWQSTAFKAGPRLSPPCILKVSDDGRAQVTDQRNTVVWKTG